MVCTTRKHGEHCKEGDGARCGSHVITVDGELHGFVDAGCRVLADANEVRPHTGIFPGFEQIAWHGACVFPNLCHECDSERHEAYIGEKHV